MPQDTLFGFPVKIVENTSPPPVMQVGDFSGYRQAIRVPVTDQEILLLALIYEYCSDISFADMAAECLPRLRKILTS